MKKGLIKVIESLHCISAVYRPRTTKQVPLGKYLTGQALVPLSPGDN